jgi:two-component system cell cycle response regulator DivK
MSTETPTDSVTNLQVEGGDSVVTKAKILYIEDNFDNMTLVKRVLEIEGYEVLQAGTGQEGIAKAFASQPDIVITDINLPDIDGYMVTNKLKQDQLTAHIPVIAMTANVMEKDKETVFEAGCDGYISKPIDVDELPNQIENFLKGNF